MKTRKRLKDKSDEDPSAVTSRKQHKKKNVLLTDSMKIHMKSFYMELGIGVIQFPDTVTENHSSVEVTDSSDRNYKFICDKYIYCEAAVCYM